MRSAPLGVSSVCSRQRRGDDLQALTIFGRPAEETGAIPFMAGWADLFDLDKQTVLIAVHIEFFYALGIAGCFALDPIFLTRSAPEGNAPCCDRSRRRLFI